MDQLLLLLQLHLLKIIRLSVKKRDRYKEEVVECVALDNDCGRELISTNYAQINEIWGGCCRCGVI